MAEDQHPLKPDRGESSPAPAGDPAEAATDVTLTWEGTCEPSAAQINVPRQLGNVRLGEELGRGGMGIVYQGWDEVLHRAVAVKFLLGAAPQEGDPHFEQFLTGARAEAAVRHLNIVPVHAAGLVEDAPYVVMDYIDGPTLREVTQRHGPVTLPVALKVMWDIASAVAALHEQGFVHRDLKPANVLFDRKGQLLVTDFGLAALRRRREGRLARAGTPIYMAPEAFEGRALPQTDVYALGIMLYELLVGDPPFTGDRDELHVQHADTQIPLARLVTPATEEVAEVVERALHKREVFRHKSAQHFQRALCDAGATPDLLHDGETELQVLITRTLARDAGPCHRHPGTQTPSHTYFDRLSEIAAEKRKSRPDSDSGSGPDSDSGAVDTPTPEE